MARSGHASFQTTLAYVHLAGERFGDAAELLEAGVFGESTPHSARVSLSA
jgi:hypothetical protein